MSVSDAAPLPRAGEVFFDVRGNSRTMRLSWYADTGVAVFSIWQGPQCTGTFRLPIDELPRMVEILRRGPDGSAADAPAAAVAPARAQGPGYQPEQPPAGYPDRAPALPPDPPAYPDLPGYPDWPADGYPAEPATAYPAGSRSGQPDRYADGYLPDAPGYPGDRAASYQGPGRRADGYPDDNGYPRDSGYPGGNGYPGDSGYPGDNGYPYQATVAAAYPGGHGSGYPDQPGSRDHGRPADYLDDPDTESHLGPAEPRSFAAVSSSLDFPSVPSGQGHGDGPGRRHADLPPGRRDNHGGTGVTRTHALPAESFPYGEPPDNLELPLRRGDTRTSLR